MDWIAPLTPWFVAVMGVVTGVVVAWINKRGSGPQLLIDQLQEERNNAVDGKESLEQKLLTRIEALEAKVGAQEMRERILFSYIFALQHHINEQLPPPPPEWPKELVTI